MGSIVDWDQKSLTCFGVAINVPERVEEIEILICSQTHISEIPKEFVKSKSIRL